MGSIADNYHRLRDSIPDDVKILAATKDRTVREVEEVIEAGAKVIGENYTRPEALRKYEELGPMTDRVEWHLIGHLQKNDINKALPMFDLIQTVESFRKARHIDKRVPKADKDFIRVYIEVNSAKEESKYGINPEFRELKQLLVKMKELSHIRVEGLMTMGPYSSDPEEYRPFFQSTRSLFEKAKELNLENSEMKVLSMGMSHSYQVAIEEGANMVRIGTEIFGPRD